MSTSRLFQPLLVLDEARVQAELRRAAINDFLVGLVIIGVSIHMSTGDLASVVFYLGLLRALCWPMWTVLVTLWLEENG